MLEKFKEYEAMVTNMTEKKIKILRSDNGGERNLKNFPIISKKRGFSISMVHPKHLNRVKLQRE